MLLKINFSLCSLGICSQWNPLSLCTAHSLVLPYRRWKELGGFGSLSVEMKREKTCASHKRETAQSNRIENAMRRASANQQTKTMRLWSRKQLSFLLCPCLAESGCAFLSESRNKAQERRKVDGQGLQPSRTKMDDVCVDTLLCLENRCKSVLIFQDVLHSSLTPPS